MSSVPVGDHPGQRIEPLRRVSGRAPVEGQLGQHDLADAGAQVVAGIQGGDVVFGQLRADQQPHPPAVGDEPDDAGGGRGQRRRAEVAGAAVIGHAGRERRQVEALQRVVAGR